MKYTFSMFILLPGPYSEIIELKRGVEGHREESAYHFSDRERSINHISWEAFERGSQ